MISRAVFEELRSKHGKTSSWAIWRPEGDSPKSNIDDLSIFEDPLILQDLNTTFVFVGLNPADHTDTKGNIKDWSAFHSSDAKRQQDYKLRNALSNTVFWGSYITDIIKKLPETDGNMAADVWKKDPELRQYSVDALKDELSIIGGEPTLIAIGAKAFNILKDIKSELRNVKNIAMIDHYSGMISPDEYKLKTGWTMLCIERAILSHWDNYNINSDSAVKYDFTKFADDICIINSPLYGGEDRVIMDRLRSVLTYERIDRNGYKVVSLDTIVDPEVTFAIFRDLDSGEYDDPVSKYALDGYFWKARITTLNGKFKRVNRSVLERCNKYIENVLNGITFKPFLL